MMQKTKLDAVDSLSDFPEMGERVGPFFHHAAIARNGFLETKHFLYTSHPSPKRADLFSPGIVLSKDHYCGNPSYGRRVKCVGALKSFDPADTFTTASV